MESHFSKLGEEGSMSGLINKGISTIHQCQNMGTYEGVSIASRGNLGGKKIVLVA